VAVTEKGKTIFCGNGRQNKYTKRRHRSLRKKLGKLKKAVAISLSLIQMVKNTWLAPSTGLGWPSVPAAKDVIHQWCRAAAGGSDKQNKSLAQKEPRIYFTFIFALDTHLYGETQRVRKL